MLSILLIYTHLIILGSFNYILYIEVELNKIQKLSRVVDR